MKLFFSLFVSLLLAVQLIAGNTFVVAGYQPYWSKINEIQFDKLTHIHYSFLKPNSDGTVIPVPNAQRLKDIVFKAHANNVKVGIAIGGWNNGDDSAFETLAQNEATRKKFVTELMKVVKEYDLDGVDMDWEYPDAGESSQNYRKLMQALSVQLHKEKKFLSAAVVSFGKKGEGIDEEVFQYLDMLNIMAYDGKMHSSYKQAIDAVEYWSNRGCPKSKLVLGLPFYGRTPYMSYRNLLENDLHAHAKDVIGKVHYNGVAMIQKKTQLALQKCGGVMIWELSQDAVGEHSLLKAIDNILIQQKKN